MVTGAASGIGYQTAQVLNGLGATVAAVDANSSIMREPTYQQSPGFLPAVLDVTDARAVIDFVATLNSGWGRIDILVNAAGIYRSGEILDFTLSDTRDLFEVNVLGTLIPSQSVARVMVPTGGGAIVNVSSIAAHIASEVNGVYAATKGAVEALTRGMAIGLASQGIRVNAVAPGPIATPIATAALQGEDYSKRMLSRIALDRIGQPTDVAEAVAFLCSHQARWITGSVLTVDGGIRALR
ncbi:SDR family NAD(P)-dependent oxidoreductase [Arthrobacter sp. 4R501]|uniref:SDR family NAD(P)-dependent oxidoreductase n=1 Tax=Arthrobacter sp. 4R501 TaxID=2058886 RepID=UPI0011B0474A|nr:SDR family oxidoreductase [Arthrobacter sp. 4R501]